MKNPQFFDSVNEIINPHIVQSINGAMTHIPNAIRLQIPETQTHIPHYIKDLIPSPERIITRGHGNKDVRYASAFYLPEENIIYIPQKKLDPQKHVYIAVKESLRERFLHEAGHAFDICHKPAPFSSTPGFKNDYEQDVIELFKKARSTCPKTKNLYNHIIKTYSYYISKTHHTQGKQPHYQAAREEVIAQAFANIIGGFINDSNEIRNRGHKKAFPRSYAALEFIIKSYAPDAELYPDLNHLDQTQNLELKPNCA